MQKLLGEGTSRAPRPYYRGPRVQYDSAALFSRHFINPGVSSDWLDLWSSGGKSTSPETKTQRRKRLNTLMSDAINSRLSLARSLASIARLEEEKAVTELKKVAKNSRARRDVGLAAVKALDHLKAGSQLEMLGQSKHAPEHVTQAAKHLVKIYYSFEGAL